MWLRLTRSEFVQGKGDANRRAFRTIVESGEQPGVLAYAAGEPVGWVAVAPRDKHPVWDRSRNFTRIDDAPVWSISCFFIARPWRHHGIARQLIAAAVGFARERGAKVLEGYPIDGEKASPEGSTAWTGFLSAFTGAGFEECARRAPTRPMVRLKID
jgi:GNAT superfamily N-acetyltransferase